MRTILVPATVCLLLVSLAPAASAGVVETASCSLGGEWAHPTVDALWDATAAFACAVGGIVAGEARAAACTDVQHPFTGPVGALIDAALAFECQVVTILA